MNADDATLRHWRIDHDASAVAWLGLDRHGSGTNVLSRDVMDELATALDIIERRRPQGLVVYSAKPDRFIAGADVHEFPLIKDAADAATLASAGRAIFDRLAGLGCPSVAVINGSALGGGLELALAATWRLALDSSRTTLGLPEVKLGLHPGFGGTVRCVRLLGVRKAMDLMLTGRAIDVHHALRIGLLDRVCPADHWRHDALQLLALPRPRRRPPLLDRLMELPLLRPRFAALLTGRIASKADRAHYPAPYAIINLWREHGATAAAAFAAETESFSTLAATDTSRNLVRVFLLQDRLKHLAPRNLPPAKHVHVIGAGVMGGDIAAWCAAQGLTVTLQDRETKYVEPALVRGQELFSRLFSDERERREAVSRLRCDISGEGAVSADVVIEAIFENLEAKQSLLRGIEVRLKPNCVLTTNTSSIPLQQLASCLTNPERLVGLHFFNPVAKLPLVEIVRADITSQASMDACLAFAGQIRKLPLPCRSHPGFLVNRVLGPYIAEAMCLMREGVALADIDGAATQFGMPMGPIELADSVGLDVALHVARILAPILGRPVAPELEQMVQAGQLGRKTGRGFYVYHDGRPVRSATTGRAIANEIQDRLILALLNEAAHCLAEHIVDDPDLIDAAIVFGTGFAPFRGGPLHYAKHAGVEKIIDRLQELAERHGPRFAPSKGWEQLLTM